MNGNVDAVILHALKPPYRLTEHDARARVFVGHLENFLAGADLVRGQNGQRFNQRPLDSAPVAEQIARAHRDVFESHLRGADHETENRLDGYTRGIAINEHERRIAALRTRGAQKSLR